MVVHSWARGVSLGMAAPCARAGGGPSGAWGGTLGVLLGGGALGAEESLGVLAACVRGWGGPLGTQVGPLWVLGGSFGCAGNLGVSR